jgi:hypothetical protein
VIFEPFSFSFFTFLGRCLCEQMFICGHHVTNLEWHNRARKLNGPQICLGLLGNTDSQNVVIEKNIRLKLYMFLNYMECKNTWIFPSRCLEMLNGKTHEFFG